MLNLLLLAAAMTVSFRIISPWLRIAIMVTMKLVGFAFLIAVVLLLAVAVLTHGAFL